MVDSAIWAAQRHGKWKKKSWKTVKCEKCSGDMWILDPAPAGNRVRGNDHGKFICRACSASSKETMEQAMQRVNERKRKIKAQLSRDGQIGKHGRYGGR